MSEELKLNITTLDSVKEAVKTGKAVKAKPGKPGILMD